MAILVESHIFLPCEDLGRRLSGPLEFRWCSELVRDSGPCGP